LGKLSIRKNDRTKSVGEHPFDLRETICFNFIQRDHWNCALTGEPWKHRPVTATWPPAEQPATTIFSGSIMY
jgi:hypothetical protein